ncbi:hypothetical protein N9873_03060 [Akkermansiaceae bacterium]|nr:hypothetical protein [Akkermansiaceae bacterium]
MKKRLIVATRNAHKVEEIRAILDDYEVCDLSVLTDPPEVEETGTTFLANATLKALAISEITDVNRSGEVKIMREKLLGLLIRSKIKDKLG